MNYQLLHSYELVVPEGTGELSGLHIIDPVPEVFIRCRQDGDWKFLNFLMRTRLRTEKLIIKELGIHEQEGQLIRKLKMHEQRK